MSLRARLVQGLAGIALSMLAATASADALTLKTVRVCDDANEWPPFTYREPAERDLASAAGQPGGRVVGYSVEVLQRILQPLGIKVHIELLPWLRCLREVESGQQFQMALNASASPERERSFLLTRAYYDTTHAYFFSRLRFPQGLPIQGVRDLAKYKVCGVHGYNYAAYGLRDDQVDRGALEFSRVIAKLLADRCELGLEKLEAVQATRYRGQPLLADPNLGYAPVPGMAKGEFHMLVSRQHPQGPALLEALNRGLKTLQDSGQLQAIRKRYLP